MERRSLGVVTTNHRLTDQYEPEETTKWSMMVQVRMERLDEVAA